jgi:hypothetical protein
LQSDEILKISEFCRKECVEQGDPDGFLGMMRAYFYAIRISDSLDKQFFTRYPTEIDVRVINGLVLGVQSNYRNVPVFFEYDLTKQAIDAAHISRCMEIVHRYVSSMDAQHYFSELMDIHPFIDGNGRTGQIAANWVNRSLKDPVKYVYSPRK